MTSYRPLKPGSLEKEVDVKTIAKAIRAGGLPVSSIDKLDSQFNGVVGLTWGATGWHGPTDIQTLTGLEGTYFWGEKPFGLNYITFTFAPDKAGVEGAYKITNGWSVVEEGIFHSVPNNPAIGWAFISLAPEMQQTPRVFIISGMVTDPGWKISTLLLNHVGHSGPVLPAFPAIRLF